MNARSFLQSLGSIVQHYSGISPYFYADAVLTLPPGVRDVLSTYARPASTLCPEHDGPFKYESRVMQGIWAAAPYLHNGSVPTLADLLERPENRPVSFRVGRHYDTARIGLAADQGSSTAERITTGCDQRNSGNSRCGHNFGTNLSDADKLALLEYLKTL